MPTQMNSRTTVDLVEDARQGGSRAWDEVVIRYGRMVAAVAARYRMQEADAADVVQNTWLRAFERLDTLRDPERLGAWLATIAARECLAQIVRSRREVPNETVGSTQSTTAPGPESVVLAAETSRAVDAAVEGLNEFHKQLMYELFYRPEQNYASVSRSTGIPMGSIGPTRGRVLRNLRETLERAGFGTVSPTFTTG